MLRVFRVLVVTLPLAPSAAGQCSFEKVVASDAMASDQFGYAVSVSGDTAVVGAPLGGDPPQGDSGAVYVLEKQGASWTETEKLTASDAANGDQFGQAVAIDGDVMIVGSPLDNNQSGSAYVFERQGTVWSESAKLVAPDASSADLFGTSVSVSGTIAIVGAQLDDNTCPGVGCSNSGSAYIFERVGSSWIWTAKLIAPDAATDDRFGSSVAVDGATAVVGAPQTDGGQTNSGSAYVFQRVGAIWVEIQELSEMGSPVGNGDDFGRSVSVEGTRILIGAPGDDAPSSESGSVYVFENTGTWTQLAKLSASNARSGALYGGSAALDGTRALVGAYNSASGSGSAYVLDRQSPALWTETTILIPSDVQPNDAFGWSVGLSGDTALVGARLHDAAGSDAGAVYVFSANQVCDPGVPSCFGIGCPCGNDDAAAGCANSTGSGALLTGSGSTSVAADDLLLTASGCPPNNSGLFFSGNTTFAPPFIVGDGFGCVGGLSFRYFPGVVNASGVFTKTDLASTAPAGLIVPGTTRHFQAWTRDVTCGPPAGSVPEPVRDEQQPLERLLGDVHAVIAPGKAQEVGIVMT